MSAPHDNSWLYHPDVMKGNARIGFGHFGDFDSYARIGDPAVIGSHTVIDGNLADLYAVNISCFLRTIGFRSIDRLLDAGCAIGMITGALGQTLGPGVEIHGIDLSASAIEAARARFPACRFVVGSADDLAIEDSSIDVIHAREFYPFTRSADADLHTLFLKSFVRKLKPGGAVIAVQIIDKQGLADSFEELRNRVGALGFSKIRRYVMVPRRIYVWLGRTAYHPLIYPVISLAGRLLEALRPGEVSYFYVFRKSA